MKKSPENDPVRMRHMLEAAYKIRKHTSGRSRADLDTDELLALGVVRLIEILGEAASQITEETRVHYPQVQWQDIADMRNRVIHGYFSIELDIVWNTVTENIPPLIAALETILPPPKA
jgi:uncharacterized protein with HEPN domain